MTNTTTMMMKSHPEALRNLKRLLAETRGQSYAPDEPKPLVEHEAEEKPDARRRG